LKQIQTIDQLVSQLRESNKEDIKNIINALHIPVSEFEKYATWNSTHYTRNCIVKTPKFELLLLCWQAGHETPVHCHNDQDCWVFLIDGSILERQYKRVKNGIPKITVIETMQESGSYFINDEIGLHSLHNSNNKRAMSLHVYVNPIEECTYYSKQLKKFRTKKLEYDTYLKLN
jgi:cysteine dioxygenase